MSRLTKKPRALILKQKKIFIVAQPPKKNSTVFVATSKNILYFQKKSNLKHTYNCKTMQKELSETGRKKKKKVSSGVMPKNLLDNFNLLYLEGSFVLTSSRMQWQWFVAIIV